MQIPEFYRLYDVIKKMANADIDEKATEED